MKKRPNILLIITDQQRYDCIGYSNDYPVKTPNLDRLASQGIWFSNAYTPIPLCCPARQSLLNGRRPEAFGGLWNYQSGFKIGALEPEEYSWPRELGEMGYQSTYIGKWHVHPDHDPTEYGYDRYIPEGKYFEYKKEKYPDEWFNGPWWFKNGWFGEVDPVNLEDSPTHWTAKQAVKAMEEYSETDMPWHIRMDFYGPHLPCTPVKEFADTYRQEEVPVWRSFGDEFKNKPYIQKQQLYNWNIQDFTWEDWSKTVAMYYAMITQIDDAIGMVLKRLDELGMADDTLVIYTTDHGDMCGGHRMMDKHYVMYDDIVHVPLIVRWPGQIKQKSLCEDFVSNILDLPPTILEIIGKEPKDFFHGKSLLPLLRGEKPDDWRQEAVSTYNGQQFGLFTQRMIRTRRWKYVWNTTDVDELYDMENDPDEIKNLIGHKEHVEVVADLRKRLYHTLMEEGDEFVKNPWMSAQLLENRKL